MSFLEEKLGWEPELNRGLIASVVFHIAILLLGYFGVPVLFQDDVIVEPLGIQAALVSDITTAPKVDRAGKPSEKPKPAQKTEPPKKEAKPAPAKENPKPAAATPPPPPPEEKVVALPDKEKPKEEKPAEKKPEEKKVEEKPKKKEVKKEEKPKKQDTSELDSLLASVLNEPAAEPTPEEPKKKAAPEPAEPTAGPITEQISAVPLTSGEEEGIRSAIEQRWNVPAGMANIDRYTVSLRLHMLGDGTVSKIDILDPMNDQGWRVVAESAKRAVLLTQKELGRLPIPSDKYNSTIVVRWNMATICAQMVC